MRNTENSIAPEGVLRAALDVIGLACVFVRNSTLHESCSVKMLNDLMEAIHDVPHQLVTWDDERLELLRLHLRCFDSSLYDGAPNLGKGIFFR
jgi:hypothetical protein